MITNSGRMATLRASLTLTRIATIIDYKVEWRNHIVPNAIFTLPSSHMVEFIDLAYDVDNVITVGHKWNITIMKGEIH
jgi:hypothetical protein